MEGLRSPPTSSFWKGPLPLSGPRKHTCFLAEQTFFAIFENAKCCQRPGLGPGAWPRSPEATLPQTFPQRPGGPMGTDRTRGNTGKMSRASSCLFSQKIKERISLFFRNTRPPEKGTKGHREKDTRREKENLSWTKRAAARTRISRNLRGNLGCASGPQNITGTTSPIPSEPNKHSDSFRTSPSRGFLPSKQTCYATLGDAFSVSTPWVSLKDLILCGQERPLMVYIFRQQRGFLMEVFLFQQDTWIQSACLAFFGWKVLGTWATVLGLGAGLLWRHSWFWRITRSRTRWRGGWAVGWLHMSFPGLKREVFLPASGSIQLMSIRKEKDILVRNSF